MFRQWILAFALGAGLPGIAAAQWLYDEDASRARAYVVGADGSSFGLRCTTEPEDRQNILIDLVAFPIAPDTDDEDVVEFEIGTWTFNMETLRLGQSGAMVRYQSRIPFYGHVSENLRRQVKAGSVLRFTRSFDLSLDRFTLRGSRASLDRLERACLRLWAAGTNSRPTTQFPLAPSAAPAPSPPPPVENRVPEEALSGLSEYVRSVVAPQCAAAAQPTLSAGALDVRGDLVTVHLGRVTCDWMFRVHPFCGSGGCETWVYRWTGESFTLLELKLL